MASSYIKFQTSTILQFIYLLCNEPNKYLFHPSFLFIGAVICTITEEALYSFYHCFLPLLLAQRWLKKLTPSPQNQNQTKPTKPKNPPTETKPNEPTTAKSLHHHCAQLSEPLLLWEVRKFLFCFVYQQTFQLNGDHATFPGISRRETEESRCNFRSLRLQCWNLEKSLCNF